MRILALDIGQTRIGVAISDPRERVASPVCVLPANEVLSNAKSWKRVLEDWEPELILSGLPYPRCRGKHRKGRRFVGGVHR